MRPTQIRPNRAWACRAGFLMLLATLNVSGFAQPAEQAKSAAPPADNKPVPKVKTGWTAEQTAILELSTAFDKAYSEGNLDKILGMLTDDVRVTDEFGDVYEGKQAAKDLYTSAFTNRPGLKLTTSVESIRFVTDAVAIEEGVSYVAPVSGDASTSSYQAVYVKTDNGWKVSQIRDFTTSTPKDSGVHSEYLVVLNWLAGDWVVETPNGIVHMSAKWIDEGNALEMLFSRPADSGNRVQARVRIGYDPRSRQIRSWTFDTAGGHGESSWSKVQDQNSWLLKNEAVMPDGKIVTASQLLTIDPSGNKFTWATFDRSVDGVVSPTREETIVTRQAPKPANAPKTEEPGTTLEPKPGQ